jgi:adrenodoxin-NADP+ reductase
MSLGNILARKGVTLPAAGRSPSLLRHSHKQAQHRSLSLLTSSTSPPLSLSSLKSLSVWRKRPRLHTFSTTRLASSLKIAIVGSGPSGCYTAKYLQSAIEKSDLSIESCQIDVLERLPTPYGLVRYGVAPDHPEVKNVQNDFDALFANNQTTKSNIQLYANVEIGRDIELRELRLCYDAIVFCYGCESDRALRIPGHDRLDGIVSAREFVAWYNGHPEYAYIGPRIQASLQQVDSPSVVVIGHGNVALDCARVLVKGGTGLYKTDLASRALDVLGSGIPNVSIVGRRGHVQGAFTIKEVRELVKLKDEGYETDFVVQPEELDLGMSTASKQELAGAAGRPRQRIDTLLREASARAAGPLDMPKQVNLRFLLNPFEYIGDKNNQLAAVKCERTRLEGRPGQQKAVGTGEYEEIPAQLALVSIGYQASCIPGLEPYFDKQKGTLFHREGRVHLASNPEKASLYVSGWLKRGPSGIIGTNIVDAKETVNSIMQDLDSIFYYRERKGQTKSSSSQMSIDDLLREREVQVVRWDDYRRIEEAELGRRRSEEQPREKITDLDELLRVARSGQ